MSDEITGNSAKVEAATSVEPDAVPDGDAALVDDAVLVDDAPLADRAEIVEAADVTTPPELDDFEGVGVVAEAGEVVEDAPPAEDPASDEDTGDEVADAASSEDASVPAPVEPDASPTGVKPAGTKAQDKASGAGPKAARTADGSKSPKKSKKKSGKAKSGKSHADETAGSVAAQPSVATKQKNAAQNDADEPADGRRGPAGRILADNFLAVILGVVAVGLAVAFVLTMLQLRNENALGSARTSALASAKTYSVELAGYDYRHLNQDFAVVLSHSTPSFRSSFSKSSNALKSTLLKYHASAKATVVAGGVISATTSRVVTLLFLDQTVTNSTQKQPTTDQTRVEITLVRTGGKWLIDQVTLL